MAKKKAADHLIREIHDRLLIEDRHRIYKARAKGEHIAWAAIVKTNHDLDPRGAVRSANLERARMELKEYLIGFRHIGMQRDECRQKLFELLDGMISRFEFDDAELWLLGNDLEELLDSGPALKTKLTPGKGGRPRGLPIDGEELRKLRGSTSRTTFARLCGIDPDTLARVEANGRQSKDTKLKIERYLKKMLGGSKKALQKPQ